MSNEVIMNKNATASQRKKWLMIGASLLIVVAGALGHWFMRGAGRSSLAGRPVPTPDFDMAPPPAGAQSTGGAVPRPGQMLITIQPDKLENAHFKIEAADTKPGVSINTSALRTTGTIEPNAYKVVTVTPIAGGVVRQVNFELGDKVERGQKLATIFSTELADAQTAYLSMLAEIERHHQKYKRAEKLVEIGAASREEFEEVSAEYKIEQAKLTAARQKLLLLGMNAKQVDDLRDSSQTSALISIEAPASGVVFSRSVNAGEVVTMGKELFRIADLSTVWVIGQIYEKDIAEARVGAAVVITAPAYPGRSFTGRVSYVDPRVEPQTRTTQIRAEVKNPNDMLKLGMFVDVNFGEPTAMSAQAIVRAPRGAVQMIGAKQVVFVVTDRVGVFAQREVSAGPESDGAAPIYAGLTAGERVVTDGSFLLRAESLKLDPAQLTASKPPSIAPNQAAAQPTSRQAVQPSAQQIQVDRADSKPSQPSHHNPGRTQTVAVMLTEKGYQPDSFKLQKGIPARITFVRKVEGACGTELVLSEYNIKRELPLNQPVVVEFTPSKTGEFKFACGMDMLRGKVLVK